MSLPEASGCPPASKPPRRQPCTYWLAIGAVVTLAACSSDGTSAPNGPPPRDTTAPVVHLTLSANTITQRGNAVMLVVDTRDTVGVTRVEFMATAPGGAPTKFATDSVAPFQAQFPDATFTAAQNGDYQFLARAFDAAGNVGTSNAVNLTVTIDATPPFIALVPSGSKVTTPGRLVIVANTNGLRLELYDNNVKVSETPITSIPQLFTLTYTAADNGVHVYTAKAYIDDIVTTSAPVTVVTDIRWEWAQTVDRAIPRGVVLDGAGGVFMAGELRDAFGRPDAFVARYDANGSPAWLRTFGDSLREIAHGAAAETNGDVYIAGEMNVWSSGSPPILEDQCFIAKYDGAGNLVWSRAVASAVSEQRGYVATDGDGGVYLAGVTWGGVDGNANTGRQDVFVAKYDRAGTKLWTRQFGSTGGPFNDDVVTGIAADPARNAVYVVGFTDGSFEGNANAGSNDLFVAKYDRDGNRLWVRQLGTSDLDVGIGVTVGPAGDVYVTGWTRGGVGGSPTTTGADIVLAKYDPAGSLVWVRQLGSTVIYVGSAYDYGNAVTADAGGVYLTGLTTGNLDGNSYQGFSDLILVKYDHDGRLLWTRTLGTQVAEEGWGLASDGLGNVYVGGYVDGAAPWPIGVLAKHRDSP